MCSSDLDLEQAPCAHRVIRRADQVGVWRVLHPESGDRNQQGDDSALVLLGAFHSTRVLLLSDLGRSGQEALMTREKDLHADIVVAGLPEQTEPLCGALFEKIRPRVVVIADSEFPATKRANRRLRERLAQYDAAVIYTRAAGAVTLTIGKAGWALRAMDGTRFSSNDPRPHKPSPSQAADEER